VHHRRIIKRGPIVVATREDGSMDPESTSSQGLFLADTRYLSRFQLRLNGVEPVLLGSTEEVVFQSSFLHTNPQLDEVPARALGVLQRNSIEEGAVKIEIVLANWALKETEIELSIEIDSDFFDSFEARGVKRVRRGEVQPIDIGEHAVKLSYIGLDHVTRSTTITATPPMDRCVDKCLYFPVKLEAGGRTRIHLELALLEEAPEGVDLKPEPRRVSQPFPDWFEKRTAITTSNASVNAVLQRSCEDLEVLMLDFGDVWIPAAGLPRFAVPFGRDSLITGLETLIWNPILSRDALKFLAARQGKEDNPWNYEEPGKIMHEMHTGELARLKEVPFGQFYGSVDSTVLFLVLGAEYIRWTHDLDLYHELEAAFDAAWKWVETSANIDGSGYVQYQAHTPPKVSSAALTVGLFNQGWKDSATAVMYADGTMVTDHPVALAEVQGDLYRALAMWSGLFLAMPASQGKRTRGIELAARAAKLKEQFNREFWMPERGFYAMALDGKHRQVDSITSNPVQCLWARLVDDDHVDEFASNVMSESLFSTWGLRTMADTEKAYNPLSYHDGSIWPFENALVAAGLKKYGFVAETQKVFDALLDASLHFEYRRWPEVYAGVSKEVGGVLAIQPDASRPQAWSAGAMFSLIQTVLGIAPNPFSHRIDVTPALPACLNEVVVDNMSIAGCSLSLRVVRDGASILMEIKDNPDDLDIVIHPPTRHTHVVRSDDGPAVSG
jgi:glycogen debranching enzyme